MYQKEIIYMGLHKDGNRLGNAGFLKVERRDQTGRLFLCVKNVPHSISGRFPVRYYSGDAWKETDGVTLKEGGGQWEKEETDSLEQVRLQILLPNGYLVEGTSRGAEERNPAPKGERAAEEQEDAPKSENSARILEKPPIPENSVKILEEPSILKNNGKVPEESPTSENIGKVPETTGHIIISQEKKPAFPMPPQADVFPVKGIKENKWEQILDTYAQIHPYGDERVYVKVEPKDFIILSAKYQHLVNNSFLLHGFYNYRHVILGKEKDYYLGVPGVFYEREKMVALMFGFDAFECAYGDPKEGDFGYYLRKVEL